MLAEKDKKYILHPFTTYRENEFNIPVVRGEGALLFDENGREYIDAVGSWWVNLHGHSHPYINQKISEQLNRLEHVMFSGFTHAPAVDLAERLLARLGGSFSQLFYSDNGSTSVEVALKMAVQYWKNKHGETRKTCIAFRNSYHGDTFGSMSVSERDVFVEPFLDLLFSVGYIDVPGDTTIDSVAASLEELIKQHRPAAFIFEPLVQGAGGMRMYRPEHLDRLIAICHTHGVLCIADEVMTGFGRTGKWFACDHLRNKPDLICLSKGLTGGYLPLGVTAFSDEIASVFTSGEAARTFYHGHSYTANPLACTAALASLDLMEKEETQLDLVRIEKAHRQFAARLASHPLVQDARVSGVILAFDVNRGDEGYFYLHPVKNILYSFFIAEGVVLRPLGNVIYIIPPYCIADAQLQQVYKAVEKGLEHLQNEFS